MQIKKFVFAGLMATVLLSCNDNKGGTNETAGSDTSETKSQTGNANSAVRANINVTITGGDMAGSYSAECKDACCSWGIAGENVFGNQYSETGKGPKELSSVQLVVDGVTGNKSTKEFLLTVSFGELFAKDSKSFNIDTRAGHTGGSGTLDLQYEGEKAVVTIKGVSAEGPTIDLKMNCSRVITAKNLGQ
jgi:hypothetical protein